MSKWHAPVASLPVIITYLFRGGTMVTISCHSSREALDKDLRQMKLRCPRHEYRVNCLTRLCGRMSCKAKMGVQNAGSILWKTIACSSCGAILRTSLKSDRCNQCPSSQWYGGCSLRCMAVVNNAIPKIFPGWHGCKLVAAEALDMEHRPLRLGSKPQLPTPPGVILRECLDAYKQRCIGQQA
eukprot:2811886-Amphidinium_carterae.1